MVGTPVVTGSLQVKEGSKHVGVCVYVCTILFY